MKVYYFGCFQGDGHRLWVPGMRTATRHPSVNKRMGIPLAELPFDERQLDGSFCPQGDEREPVGMGAVHHVQGWTIWSFWDRTEDHRKGSHSTFVAEGEHDFAAMQRIAAEKFPAVWRRVSSLAMYVVAE